VKTSTKTEKVLSPGQWKEEVRPYGALRGPDTLFLRGAAGQASGEIEGRTETFELACAGGGGPGAPMIRCLRTGVWFILSWNDLIAMAVEAGVCKDRLAPKKKKR
jgi:hypothetical protein